MNGGCLILILAGRTAAGLRSLAARRRLVVDGDEPLDVGQLVVQVLTADLVLAVVWIELEEKSAVWMTRRTVDKEALVFVVSCLREKTPG